MTQNNQSTDSIELIHCGGCERHSLLEDAKAMAQWDETDIDEPHCPRCGTRVEYGDTNAETFVPYSESMDTKADDQTYVTDPDSMSAERTDGSVFGGDTEL